MKISCCLKEGKSGILVIFLDDEPWREIHSTIFGRKPRFPNTITTPKEFEDHFLTQEYQLSKRYAIKRLSMRNYATCELKRSLLQKQVSGKTIHSVISELVRLGLCNDNEWIQSFIRQQKAKKQGPQSIILKLKAKGFPEPMIQEASALIFDHKAQKEGIDRLLETKYRSLDLREMKAKHKVVGSLLRRGFELDEIRKCISIRNNVVN